MIDPTLIYVSIVFIAVSICAMALTVGRGPTRSCPECRSRVAISSRRCRHCKYRFQ